MFVCNIMWHGEMVTLLVGSISCTKQRFHLLVPETFVFIRQNKCLVGMLVAVMGAKVCVQYAAGNCNGTVGETTESELRGRVEGLVMIAGTKENLEPKMLENTSSRSKFYMRHEIEMTRICSFNGTIQ